MAFQKPPVDSRNIYTTGVVQQACASGTIKTPSDLLEWTKIATMAYDRYMSSDSNAVKESAFAIVTGHLNGCADVVQLEGDEGRKIPPLYVKLEKEIQLFYNDPVFKNLYTQLYNLTRERLLK